MNIFQLNGKIKMHATRWNKNRLHEKLVSKNLWMQLPFCTVLASLCAAFKCLLRIVIFKVRRSFIGWANRMEKSKYCVRNWRNDSNNSTTRFAFHLSECVCVCFKTLKCNDKIKRSMGNKNVPINSPFKWCRWISKRKIIPFIS